MNGAGIQEKVYMGYAKAATKVGTPFTLYRASSISDPISDSNIIERDFMVAVSQDSQFSQPSKYGNAVWKGLLDGRVSQPGDYLVADDHTYFIQDQPHILPITLVECNTTITVTRPTQASGKGVMSYGGDTRANEEVVMGNWPASQIIGPKWERNKVNLPTDDRLPYFIFLIPKFGLINDLRTSDILGDGLDRRYFISAAELTSFGWRIQAGFQGA